MKNIKFSEDYEKLPLNWIGTQAILISVTPHKISKLKMAVPSFIYYDTKFRNKNDFYIFDFEDCLILTFIHINTGKPFTTIRRNYMEKFEYYINSIGETFSLIKTK